MTLQIIESKVGRILVSDKDKYVGRSFIEYGEFSQGEVDIFEFAIKKTDVAADIGANFGAHTLTFARLARQVYAFEPQKSVYNALCGSLALNDIKNVIPVNAAVGFSNGRIGCHTIDQSIENNVGGLSLIDLPKEMVDYEVQKIQFLEPVNFMKIDVEGMECDVIRGSSSMIRNCKPVIYVENDRRARSAELIHLIKSLGYTCYWHPTPMYNPDNFFKNEVDVFGNLCSLNMVCLPEKVDVPGLEQVASDLHPTYGYSQ